MTGSSNPPLADDHLTCVEGLFGMAFLDRMLDLFRVFVRLAHEYRRLNSE